MHCMARLSVLIEPCGIERHVTVYDPDAVSEVLIEPCGIESRVQIVGCRPARSFNRALWD